MVKKCEEAAETCGARWFVTQSHLGTLCWKQFVKGQALLRKYLTSDWVNHLSVTNDHRVTSTNQINGLELIGKIKLFPKTQERKAIASLPLKRAFSVLLCSSFIKEILSSSDVTDAIAASAIAFESHHC